MKIWKSLLIAVAIVSIQGGSAFAAEEAAEVRHGGVTTVLKNRDYELVAKPNSFVVYVYQDEKPASTKDAKGTLTLVQGAEKQTVALTPTGENALEGKGAFKIAPGAKAVATITLSGRKPQEVNWTLK